MLLFCPSCSNTLTIARVPSTTTTNEHNQDENPSPDAKQNRFECRTCPYQFTLTRTYYERTPFPHAPNPDNDILGGADAWKNVDKTPVAACANEKCDGREAFFMQVQIRSADEPMTSFYKCVKCGREWRE